MHSLLERYLSEVAAHLSALPSKQSAEELREVQAHLENAIRDTQDKGVSEAEAVVGVLEQSDRRRPSHRALWRRGGAGKTKERES